MWLGDAGVTHIASASTGIGVFENAGIPVGTNTDSSFRGYATSDEATSDTSVRTFSTGTPTPLIFKSGFESPP